MAASRGLLLWQKSPSVFFKYLAPGKAYTSGLIKNGKSVICNKLLLWTLRGSVCRDSARRSFSREVTKMSTTVNQLDQQPVKSGDCENDEKLSPLTRFAVQCGPLSSKNASTKAPAGVRNFSDGGEDPKDKKPLKLMDFKEIIWPHPLKSLRNFWFSLLIRGYYDNSYNTETFLKGAEQAITTVSNLVSEGRFDDLESLVSRDAIREIRKNYNELSTKQKKFLKADPSDVFFRFIYEIGMIFDDHSNQRFVEITAVFQGIHGWSQIQQENSQDLHEQMKKSEEKIYICNYRFIREFTKGVEDNWTINKLNHFSPKELVLNTGIFQR